MDITGELAPGVQLVTSQSWSARVRLVLRENTSVAAGPWFGALASPAVSSHRESTGSPVPRESEEELEQIDLLMDARILHWVFLCAAELTTKDEHM